MWPVRERRQLPSSALHTRAEPPRDAETRTGAHVHTITVFLFWPLTRPVLVRVKVRMQLSRSGVLGEIYSGPIDCVRTGVIFTS